MIEGATGKILLQQMAAVAELEAGMIFSSKAGGRGYLPRPRGGVACCQCRAHQCPA